MNDEKLVKNLSKLFTNKKFLESIAKSKKNYSIKMSYGNVLEYYICTRDKNFNQSYDEILEKLHKIKIGAFEELGLTHEQVLLNARENGFITSAMNGSKAERVKKYGLDYFDKLNDKENKKMLEGRNALNKLENLLGKSVFIEYDEKRANPKTAKQIFFSTPGPKTIHYALSASPERLYKGPLDGIENFPMIYGEPKKEYYLRFVKDKIAKLGLENKSDEIIECMDKVFEIYCKTPPIIAMLSNKQAFEIEFRNGQIDECPPDRLDSRINGYARNEINTYFSEDDHDGNEHNNMGNLVTVVNQIPKEGVKGFIHMLDSYEIHQILAKEKGAKVGDIIELFYGNSNGSFKENQDVISLADVLKSVKSNEEFEYLTEKINSIIDEEVPGLKEKYGEISQEELENRINELKEKREEILDKDFVKKEGVESTFTLRQTVYDLEKNQIYDQLLEDDEKIKNDELQYGSDLHGTNHTRRVNFFANVIIMRNKQTLGKQKDVILAAVKNHDIGRINDYEDKEHGDNSAKILMENPERLEGFNEKEKEQILFAIRQHSLSKKENEAEMDKLLREKLIQEKGEDYSPEKEYEELTSSVFGKEIEFNEVYDNLINRNLYEEKKVMNVLKNADKLDRVRLDPYGINPREGLDTDRFVGDKNLVETAKDMEYLAYESLGKVTELLDIDRELRDLEKYLYLEKGAKLFEENIPLAKANIENIEKSKKTLVSEINVGGLSKINNVVRNFKDKFKQLFQGRDGTDRENE